MPMRGFLLEISRAIAHLLEFRYSQGLRHAKVQQKTSLALVHGLEPNARPTLDRCYLT